MSQTDRGNTDTYTGIEGVRGTSFADTLTGSDRVDSIEFFEGMAGNDTITGGLGIDRAEYGQSGKTGVFVNLYTGFANDGFGSMDTLSGIEQVSGSRLNDGLIGDDGANRLDGGEGNDFLEGGVGNDAADRRRNAVDELPDSDTANYFRAQVTSGVTVNLATGTATDGSAATTR